MQLHWNWNDFIAFGCFLPYGLKIYFLTYINKTVVISHPCISLSGRCELSDWVEDAKGESAKFPHRCIKRELLYFAKYPTLSKLHVEISYKNILHGLKMKKLFRSYAKFTAFLLYIYIGEKKFSLNILHAFFAIITYLISQGYLKVDCLWFRYGILHKIKNVLFTLVSLWRIQRKDFYMPRQSPWREWKLEPGNQRKIWFKEKMH